MREDMTAILKRLEALERRAMVQDAVLEIERLMSRHQFYYAAGYGEKITDELWLLDDESCVEYGASGRYKEPLNVRSFYYDRRQAGKLSVFALTTRLIEVDLEARHARGCWIALGAESDAGDLGPNPIKEKEQRRFLMTSVTEDGKRYRAEWLWQQYCVDFVHTEDGWKIHNFHAGEFFRCPFDRDWVVFSKERMVTDGMWLEAEFDADLEFPHGEHMPSKPSTFHWQYTVDTKPEIFPALIDAGMETKND